MQKYLEKTCNKAPPPVLQRAQLGVMEAEMRSLRDSLEEEQRRFAELSRESHRTTSQLQAHIQQLSSDQQGALQDKARLQVTLPWDSPGTHLTINRVESPK